MTDFGILKLLTTPSIILKATGILWNFISGSFIKEAIGQMQLGVYGVYIGSILQIMFILAIGFIFLKLVLRINV